MTKRSRQIRMDRKYGEGTYLDSHKVLTKDGSPVRVHRVDRGGLGAPRKREDGSVVLDAYLCRTGVQEYRMQDGSIVREFRPPEEVLAKDHLDSMANRAVTIGHPDQMVDVTTAANVMHGATGDTFEVDEIDGEKWVRGRIALLTEDAVEAVESGEMRETSQGYSCQVVFEGGRYDGKNWGPDVKDGVRYDAIQTQIRANHTAVLPAGRAWVDASQEIMRVDGTQVCLDGAPPHPGPRATTDADDGEEQDTMQIELYRKDAEGKIVPYTKDIKIDAEGGQLIVEVLKMLFGALTGAQSEGDGFRKELDAKDAELVAAKQAQADAEKAAKDAKDAAEQAKADAVSPEARKARRELEAQAKKHLDAEADIDAMSDADLQAAVRTAVIKDAFPDVDLTDREDSFLAPLYDIAMQRAQAKAAEDAGDADKQDEIDEDSGYAFSAIEHEAGAVNRSDKLDTDGLSNFLLAQRS